MATNIIYDYMERDVKFPYMQNINAGRDMKDRGFAWHGVVTCPSADCIKFLDVTGDTSGLPSYLTVQS